MTVTKHRRVIFVIPTSLDGQQGPVAAWLNGAGWANAAQRLGYASTILTSMGPLQSDDVRGMAHHEPKSQVSVPYRMASRLPRPVKIAIKDVREWQRAQRFARRATAYVPAEGVEFVWQRHELFHIAGHRLARQIGCPLVLFVTAPKVWEARSWGIRRPGWERLTQAFGDKKVLQGADLLLCVSDEVASALTDLDLAREKIMVTPSTVDTDLFDPSGFERSESAATTGLVVGWVGSYRSFHSLDFLLDVIGKLTGNIPPLEVRLIGDGPERRRIEREVRNREIDPVVRFVDSVAQTQLPALMSQFDVAVVPCREAPFHYSPLKLWEYLAMGVAVVAPNVGIPGQRLRHRTDAMLYEPGSVDQMADAIIQLASDPELRAHLAMAGRKLAEANSWTAQLSRVTEQLRLVGAKHGV